MTSTFALYTSDANLLRCQVEYLAEQLRPVASGDRLPQAIGLGYVEADNILLRKKPGDVGTLDLGELVKDVVSDTLLFHVRTGEATFFDEDAMPLRFKRWMFAHQGELGAPATTRAALLATLPDFMRRQAGSSASEACFLAFMKRMRDESRGEDFDVGAPVIGALLGRTVRDIEKVERDGGVSRSTGLGFFVSNGRITCASRLGSGPLYYALLEGIPRCRRCGITEASADSNPLLRAHRRVRAVAIATSVVDPSRFLEVPEASVLCIGRNLDVHVTPLPPAK